MMQIKHGHNNEDDDHNNNFNWPWRINNMKNRWRNWRLWTQSGPGRHRERERKKVMEIGLYENTKQAANWKCFTSHWHWRQPTIFTQKLERTHRQDSTFQQNYLSPDFFFVFSFLCHFFMYMWCAEKYVHIFSWRTLMVVRARRN